MGAGVSDYRYSRCTDSRNAPQVWHWAVVDGDPTVVWREMIDAVRPHVPPMALPEVRADIRVVLERVQACEALDPEDIKNIARDRDLWEIRFQLETWDLLIRIYETEVPDLPNHVVALVAHEKVTDVSDDEIADMQNEQIDRASRRWLDGRSSFWGIT